MNKFLVSILLFLWVEVALATNPEGTERYNLLTFRQLEFENPWLQSNNPAGLSQMVELFPSELKLGYDYSNGDFHSIFNGKSNKLFDFSSRSFRRINKTYVYGAFKYNNSSEQGLNYSNTNAPSINYPYLLVDTIGNDTYRRECFKLDGVVSTPLSSKLNLGLGFDYQVGVASQNRDPRSENKVVKVVVSPGVLIKSGHFNVGCNLLLKYYNEDIDVMTVRENTQYTMFQLHGFGAHTSHTSSSFYRLYQEQGYGGGMQFEWKQGKISNLLHSRYIYSIQNVDGGRRNTTASWAEVKNDARLNGVTWDISDAFLIENGARIHQLNLGFAIENDLGKEFIQRLEKINSIDLGHWKTYGIEPKYYSLRTKAHLNYQLLGNDQNKLLRSLFLAGISYQSFDEKYYLPDQDIKYSNLTIESSFLRLFAISQSDISAEIKFKYQFNINSEKNLTENNFLVQKIGLPEFEYQTTNYFAPGLSVVYQIPVKKASSVCFFKSECDWYHSASNLNRIVFSFSTGLTF